jgi:hypothetical protein
LPRKQADLIFTLVLLAVVGWMVWEATGWGYRARLFPLAVGIPAVALAFLQLALLLKPLATQRGFTAIADRPTRGVARRSLQMVGWVLAIAVGIVLLGFELAAGLFPFLFLYFAAHERLRTSLAIALLTYVAFYLLFDRALLIQFPPGTLSEALGLDKPLDHYVLDPLANLVQTR